MRLTLPLCVLCAVSALAAETRTLFDGQTMTGWEPLGRNGPIPHAVFAVKDGLLQSVPGGKGFIWYTPAKLSNGTLKVVYRFFGEDGNSGVFIRIPAKPQSENDAIHKGIEVQIDDSEDDFHVTGTLYSMTKAQARPGKPGDWNTMEISLQGKRTIVRVNGVQVTDYDGVSAVPAKVKPYEPERGPRPEAGYIGLQNHDPKAVIAFREITFTPSR